MPQVLPLLGRGSPLQMAQMLWGPLYEARFANLGTTATIIPFGDPMSGQPSATTFTTRRGNASGASTTWTYRNPTSAAAPYSWATSLELQNPDKWQGCVPALEFNGSTELIDTPDAAYWTRGNGATDSAFSVIAYVLTDTVSGFDAIFAKWGDGAGQQEYFFILNGGKPEMRLYDQSAGAYIGRQYNSVLATGQWHHLAMTYDGSASAAGVKIYLNGAQVDDTNATSGVYVAMEDGTRLPSIGAFIDGSATYFWDGKMAGGPAGHAFVQAELTAAQVDRDYQMLRRALAL